MDLQALQIFRIVAKTGSFSKAARELNYAQSNISIKIQQLETFMETTASVHLPSLLSAYHNNYPNVDLALKTGTTEKNIHDVLQFNFLILHKICVTSLFYYFL